MQDGLDLRAVILLNSAEEIPLTDEFTKERLPHSQNKSSLQDEEVLLRPCCDTDTEDTWRISPALTQGTHFFIRNKV